MSSSHSVFLLSICPSTLLFHPPFNLQSFFFLSFTFLFFPIIFIVFYFPTIAMLASPFPFIPSLPSSPSSFLRRGPPLSTLPSRYHNHYTFKHQVTSNTPFFFSRTIFTVLVNFIYSFPCLSRTQLFFLFRFNPFLHYCLSFLLLLFFLSLINPFFSFTVLVYFSYSFIFTQHFFFSLPTRLNPIYFFFIDLPFEFTV